MRFVLATFFSLAILCNASAQAQPCESHCANSKDDIHLNPYYNRHLCENFDPKQSDFSQAYLELRTKHSGKNLVESLAAQNVGALWKTIDCHQNGIIGIDYKRIKIFIGNITKDEANKLLYHIEGKSNVNGNICVFTGTIKIIRAYELPRDESESTHSNSWHLFAEYSFQEDTRQKYTGTFKGVMECFYYFDMNGNVLLDESADFSDDYFNRSYVGTWTSNNTKAVKKCIWGDHRLPFTFDFDCGDGEMHPCDKYIQNGWTTFGNGEYDFAGGKAVLKDKWWSN